MARASDIFAEELADLKMREVKNWLQSKGVRAFEPVSLFCDQLKKVRRIKRVPWHVIKPSYYRIPSRRLKLLLTALQASSLETPSKKPSSRAFLAKPS